MNAKRIQDVKDKIRASYDRDLKILEERFNDSRKTPQAHITYQYSIEERTKRFNRQINQWTNMVPDERTESEVVDDLCAKDPLVEAAWECKLGYKPNKTRLQVCSDRNKVKNAVELEKNLITDGQFTSLVPDDRIESEVIDDQYSDLSRFVQCY